MEEKGFIGRIFDLSFDEYVTTKVIKFVFVLGIIGAGAVTLGFLFGGFGASFGKGLLCLVVSPFLFLLLVLAARIWCEMTIVLFKIADSTSRIAGEKDS